MTSPPQPISDASKSTTSSERTAVISEVTDFRVQTSSQLQDSSTTVQALSSTRATPAVQLFTSSPKPQTSPRQPHYTRSLLDVTNVEPRFSGSDVRRPRSTIYGEIRDRVFGGAKQPKPTLPFTVFEAPDSGKKGSTELIGRQKHAASAVVMQEQTSSRVPVSKTPQIPVAVPDTNQTLASEGYVTVPSVTVSHSKEPQTKEGVSKMVTAASVGTSQVLPTSLTSDTIISQSDIIVDSGKQPVDKSVGSSRPKTKEDVPKIETRSSVVVTQVLSTAPVSGTVFQSSVVADSGNVSAPGQLSGPVSVSSAVQRHQQSAAITADTFQQRSQTSRQLSGGVGRPPTTMAEVSPWSQTPHPGTGHQQQLNADVSTKVEMSTGKTRIQQIGAVLPSKTIAVSETVSTSRSTEGLPALQAISTVSSVQPTIRGKIVPSPTSRVDWAKQRFGGAPSADSGVAVSDSSPRLKHRTVIVPDAEKKRLLSNLDENISKLAAAAAMTTRVVSSTSAGQIQPQTLQVTIPPASSPPALQNLPFKPLTVSPPANTVSSRVAIVHGLQMSPPASTTMPRGAPQQGGSVWSTAAPRIAPEPEKSAWSTTASKDATVLGGSAWVNTAARTVQQQGVSTWSSAGPKTTPDHGGSVWPTITPKTAPDQDEFAWSTIVPRTNAQQGRSIIAPRATTQQAGSTWSPALIVQQSVGSAQPHVSTSEVKFASRSGFQPTTSTVTSSTPSDWRSSGQPVQPAISAPALQRSQVFSTAGSSVRSNVLPTSVLPISGTTAAAFPSGVSFVSRSQPVTTAVIGTTAPASSVQRTTTMPVFSGEKPIVSPVLARPALPTVTAHVWQPDVPQIQLSAQTLKPVQVMQSPVPENKLVLVAPQRSDTTKINTSAAGFRADDSAALYSTPTRQAPMSSRTERSSTSSEPGRQVSAPQTPVSTAAHRTQVQVTPSQVQRPAAPSGHLQQVQAPLQTHISQVQSPRPVQPGHRHAAVSQVQPPRSSQQVHAEAGPTQVYSLKSVQPGQVSLQQVQATTPAQSKDIPRGQDQLTRVSAETKSSAVANTEQSKQRDNASQVAVGDARAKQDEYRRTVTAAVPDRQIMAQRSQAEQQRERKPTNKFIILFN